MLNKQEKNCIMIMCYKTFIAFGNPEQKAIETGNARTYGQFPKLRHSLGVATSKKDVKDQAYCIAEPVI
jgi:hypothetical protein